MYIILNHICNIIIQSYITCYNHYKITLILLFKVLLTPLNTSQLRLIDNNLLVSD